MEKLILSKFIAGTMNWGLWGAKFNTSQYRAMIDNCLESGLTSFDHADIYGHYTVEEEFGEALSFDQSLRNKIQLITKCGINLVSPNRPAYQIKHYDTSQSHIEASVDRSLKNLRTDYLDLLLIHRPDPLLNPEEVAEAFTALRNSGKVRHFGVSNFSPAKLELLDQYFPLSANQVEISVTNLSAFKDGSLDQCLLKKIIPMAWSPLGGGKLFQGGNERSERILALSSILAEKYHCIPEQVLLSWLFQHPANIHPVLGTVKVSRINTAIKAADLKLTREEWFLLWRASTGEEVD